MKQISKGKDGRQLSGASSEVKGALEHALVNDLAVLQARLGKDEGAMRYGHWALFLEKERLLLVIDDKSRQDFWKERELVVEEVKKNLPDMSQGELHKKLWEIDGELEDGRKKAPGLLKEYAASFAGGIESILAAIERGARERLEKLVERRDELVIMRDAIDKLIHWPTGPC